MKNNLLAVMFLFLCLLSTLISIGLIYRYNSAIWKARDLQQRFAQANAAQTLMQQMINDTAEYNKNARNPDITKLLQPFVANNAAKPVVKPAK